MIQVAIVPLTTSALQHEVAVSVIDNYKSTYEHSNLGDVYVQLSKGPIWIQSYPDITTRVGDKQSRDILYLLIQLRGKESSLPEN